MILERAQHGRVAVLTLNRPEAANSLNPELISALSREMRALDADPETRVVILTGAGEKIFCAGMDLRAFAERSSSDDDGPPPDPEDSKMTTGFSKPLIAAVNGAAVGGGFELVLTCDLIVAAEHARFGLPEVKRGLYAAGGGTMLGTLIPLPLALETALTGDLISAPKAASWGLVNRVVPGEQLLEAALELANAIAANAPLGVAITKKVMRRAVTEDPSLGRGTPEESAVVFQSEDAVEGATAFVEKREPNWKGR